MVARTAWVRSDPVRGKVRQPPPRATEATALAIAAAQHCVRDQSQTNSRITVSAGTVAVGSLSRVRWKTLGAQVG